MENPTEGEVADAARRLYYLVANYGQDRPGAIDLDYWDPELWDVYERLAALLGVEVER